MRSRTKVSTLAQVGRSQKSGRKRSQGCFSMSFGRIDRFHGEDLWRWWSFYHCALEYDLLMQKIILVEKFGIYVDFTCEKVPRAFYVGKGTQWRCNDRRSRNIVYRRIREKHGMQRKIVFETMNEPEAYNKEREFIALYSTFVNDGGANLDRGGQGGPSHPKTPEHKEKIRQALLGRSKTSKHREAMSRSGRGKTLSTTHREKISQAIKQRRSSSQALA